MYSANVTAAAGAVSLRDMINAAVPGEIPLLQNYDGRCFLVVITPAAGATITMVFKPGAVAANEGAPLLAGVVHTYQAPSANQLSVDEIFLAGAGTAGVMVFIM
jgi:hypothetical protein